jgi:hypothetical protein
MKRLRISKQRRAQRLRIELRYLLPVYDETAVIGLP